MEKLVKLGTCHRPHGIKGAFSLSLENSEDSVLSPGVEVILFPLEGGSSLSSRGERFTLSSLNFSPKKTIAFFKEVENRNQVEEMIPFSLYIERSSMPKLEQGHYLCDFIGLKVFDEKEHLLGVVAELSHNGVQDILRIERFEGRGKGKKKSQENAEENFIEVLLLDQFVKKIDWEKGEITLLLPEYL